MSTTSVHPASENVSGRNLSSVIHGLYTNFSSQESHRLTPYDLPVYTIDRVFVISTVFFLSRFRLWYPRIDFWLYTVEHNTSAESHLYHVNPFAGSRIQLLSHMAASS